jgi:AcrR family transcriptional regulator
LPAAAIRLDPATLGVRNGNERSFSDPAEPLNQHTSTPAQAPSANRARILDAAERCFVRAGFHRASMQDVAAEAGMSAGNIYRYFASKNALVAALCERDRADVAGSFANLKDAPDRLSAFIALGRRHLVDEPRAKAVFALDLWAEASRDPALAELCRAFEGDIRCRIEGFLVGEVTSGRATGALDTQALTDLLLCIGDGLIARRARDPDFDPAPHLAHLGSVLGLACSGAIATLLKPSARAPSGD